MRSINIIILTVILFACNRRHNRLTILFDNVEGLKEGSSVYCKGLIIGEVKKLAEADDGVWVDIGLADSIRIPVNSTFIINPSVMTGAHMTIEPSASVEFLSKLDTATGHFQKAPSFDDWTADTTKQRKIRESVEKIGEGIKGLIEASKKDTSVPLK